MSNLLHLTDTCVFGRSDDSAEEMVGHMKRKLLADRGCVVVLIGRKELTRIKESYPVRLFEFFGSLLDIHIVETDRGDLYLIEI